GPVLFQSIYSFVLHVVMTKLDEDVVPRTDRLKNLAYSACSQRSFQRLPRLRVVCDCDTWLKKSSEHLPPAVPGFVRLIGHRRIAQQKDCHRLRGRSNFDGPHSGSGPVEFESEFIIPVQHPML